MISQSDNVISYCFEGLCKGAVYLQNFKLKEKNPKWGY